MKKKTGYGKRILVSILTAAMFLTGVDTSGLMVAKAATVSGLPGARTLTDSNGNVFLGGNYIEVGVSKHGSFGTSLMPSDNVTNESCTQQAFHASTSYKGLGLQSDQDGWNIGEEPLTGDFFLPGSPEERWILEYDVDGTKYTHCVADRANTKIGSWSTEPFATNTSSDDQLSARIYGVTAMGVAITIDYSFDVDDLEYKTDVAIENRSGKNISNVRFVRSFDPDQDQQKYGSYTTYNKVICNPVSTQKAGADNYAMVVARGTQSLGGFFFLAVDNRARASRGVAFSPSNASLPGLWDSAPVTAKTYAENEDIEMTPSDLNGYQNEDNAIAITFNLGTMNAGKSDSLEYYSSLDPNVSESLDKLKKTLGLNIDFRGETINGFDGAGTYDITRDEDGRQWKLVIGEDKTYILYDETGAVIDTGTYDADADLGVKLMEEWYGSTLTIQKEAQGDTTYEPAKIIIPARPGAPDDPNVPNPDNSAPTEITTSDVTTTTNSIRVKGVKGQEYTIDGGRTWKKPDASGEVLFDGLTEGTEYQVQTRTAATGSSLASCVSTGVIVKTMRMFTDIVETEYFDQEYDGTPHVVKAETAVEGAVVSYSESLAGPYRSEPYSFTEMGTNTIYYKIEKDGYYTAYGDLNATITEKTVTVAIQDVSKTYGDKDPELTYTVVDGLLEGYELTGITLTRTHGENVGSYEISGTYTAPSGSVYDVAFANVGTFTIAPKELSVSWTNTTLTYNGHPQAPAASVNGVLAGDTVEPVVTGVMEDAGEDYTATVSIDNHNYVLDESGTSTGFQIVNADQDKPILTAKNETILGRGDGTITGLTTAMQYRKVDFSSGVTTRSEYQDVIDPDMNLADGTYEVRYAAKKNYNASEATTVMIRSGRKLVITLPEAKKQVGYSISTDKKEGNWLENASLCFELAKGYSKTENFAVKLNGKAIDLNADGSYAISQMKEDQKITVEGVADITAPEGTITVQTNVWKNLVNKVTFNLFCKDAQKVKFTGSDAGSGVDSISYYLYAPTKKKAELNYADLAALDAKSWTKLTLDKKHASEITINPQEKFVIYAKVTDKAKNVTYLSTNGIVADETKPVISGIKAGENYCEDQTVTIKDKNLSKVTVRVENGKEKELTCGADGKYVLDISSVIKERGTKKLTLTAYDKSGNKTSVTVFAGHSYGDAEVTDPTAIDKGYTGYICKDCKHIHKEKETAAIGVKGLEPSDKKQLEKTKKEAQKRLADTKNLPTEAEKKLYEDVIKKSEELLQNIEKVEKEIEKIEKLDNVLPKIDSITTDDSKKLSEELKKVKDLLDVDNPDTPTESLTVKQKKKLQEYQKDLEKKQERISKISDAFDDLYHGTDEKTGIDSIPDKAFVQPSDQKNIEQLIKDIEELLDKNNGNLTEKQKKQLQQNKADLIEKLKEAAKKDIEAAYQERVKEINETITDAARRESTVKKASEIAENAKKEINQASDLSAITSKRDETKLNLESIFTENGDTKKTDTNTSTSTEANLPIVTEKETSSAVKKDTATSATDSKVIGVDYKDIAKQQAVESAEIAYGKGSIQVTIESVDENGEKETDQSIQGVMVSSYEDIIDACLDTEEKAAVEAGEGIEIRLTVSKVPENISKEDQTLVQQEVEERAKEEEGFTLASFIDIHLEKRIGAAKWKKIANAKQELEITIDIPDELKVDGAAYSIMRCHDGACVLLSDLDENPDTITIRTQLFSTYAICYAAAENVEEESEETVTTADTEIVDAEASAAGTKTADMDQTKSGDTCHLHWWILVLAILGAILLLGLKKVSVPYQTAILVIDLAAALLLAIFGTCSLDWIFFGGNAVAVIICYIIKIRRNSENR